MGFAKRMHDASKGTGEAAIGFDILGMSMKDEVTGNMRDMNEVFEESLTKLTRMEAGQKRTLASTAIFGESGGKLVVAMSGVNMSLKSATETVGKYNIGTEEAVKASAQLQQMTAHYEMFSQGVKTTILVQVVPYMRTYADELAGVASAAMVIMF